MRGTYSGVLHYLSFRPASLKPASHARLTRSHTMRYFTILRPRHVQKLAIPLSWALRLARQRRSRRAPSRRPPLAVLWPSVPPPHFLAAQLSGQGLEALKSQPPLGIMTMGWNLGRHPSRPASVANAAWLEPSPGTMRSYAKYCPGWIYAQHRRIAAAIAQ